MLFFDNSFYKLAAQVSIQMNIFINSIKIARKPLYLED